MCLNKTKLTHFITEYTTQSTKYQFWLDALTSEKTKFFRLEDQLEEFLDYTGIGDIGVFNKSYYNHNLVVKLHLKYLNHN